jgi:cytochrome c-type biogenesis protein CcmH/NrfF
MEPIDVVLMLYGFPIGSLVLMGILHLWCYYLKKKEEKEALLAQEQGKDEE